jgi:hypothetical protein
MFAVIRYASYTILTLSHGKSNTRALSHFGKYRDRRCCLTETTAIHRLRNLYQTSLATACDINTSENKARSDTYSRTIAITSTKALRAAVAPEAPLTVSPVTTRTASQKMTSKQFKIAFAFVLAHLRKRRVCSVRSW